MYLNKLIDILLKFTLYLVSEREHKSTLSIEV